MERGDTRETDAADNIQTMDNAEVEAQCVSVWASHLKFFIARLVAEAPMKPASAQMPKLITQKMPKVYPAPASHKPVRKCSDMIATDGLPYKR